MQEYLEKAFTCSRIAVGVIIGICNYLMFPSSNFQVSALAVLIAMIFDVITKYIAICHKYGGFFNALRIGKILSKSLWDGTKVKLCAYLIIFIMVGQSYKLSMSMPMIDGIPLFIGNIVYMIIFYREFQSIIENLIDRGAKLGWLLNVVKKKEEALIKEIVKGE